MTIARNSAPAAMGDMLQLLFACVAIGSAVTGPMSLSQWLCHGLRLR